MTELAVVQPVAVAHKGGPASDLAITDEQTFWTDKQKAALQQLKQSDVDIAGCVLQQVNLKRYGSYGYGDSGYYYHHGKYGQYYTS